MNAREAKRQKRLKLIEKRKAAMVQPASVEPVVEVPVQATATEAGPCVFLSELVDCGEEIQPLQKPIAGDPMPILGDLTPKAQEGAVDPSEPRLAKIYGIPHNPRLRLIEFEDGTHGRLRVKMDSQRMLGWTVWVKADGQGDYLLHGRYNLRGTRII